MLRWLKEGSGTHMNTLPIHTLEYLVLILRCWGLNRLSNDTRELLRSGHCYTNVTVESRGQTTPQCNIEGTITQKYSRVFKDLITMTTLLVYLITKHHCTIIPKCIMVTNHSTPNIHYTSHTTASPTASYPLYSKFRVY